MTVPSKVLTSTFPDLIMARENNHNPAITAFLSQQSVDCHCQSLSLNFFSAANKKYRFFFPFSGSRDDQKETNKKRKCPQQNGAGEILFPVADKLHIKSVV